MSKEEAAAILRNTAWLGSNDEREKVEEAIEVLASVQPERKKGKWLSHYDYCKKHGYMPSGVLALWWCDQCEQGVEHPTNFCPKCGADMRGEQDG